MNKMLPKASRKRLEELLKTLGSRAKDFKKCFDIESEWCWKYADLVLRGMKERDLGYAEGHHVVPACFYGKRHCSTADDGNLTVLTYGEHVLAHYCLVWCATGNMRVKMVRAFLTMYRIGMAGGKHLMPSEEELLAAIPEMELKRIRAMEPKCAKVEAEGRTHLYEDPAQYRKDYYEANREKILERAKAYQEANKENILEKAKAYYDTNKEKLLERHKVYYEANKEKLIERKKAFYKDNRGKILEQKKAYQEANKEKIAERNKAYWAANKEKLFEQNKAWREANKEHYFEYHKDYREANKEKIAERNKVWYEANKDKRTETERVRYETKKAAGYRYRTDPVTGKRGWVFVGLPGKSEAA